MAVEKLNLANTFRVCPTDTPGVLGWGHCFVSACLGHLFAKVCRGGRECSYGTKVCRWGPECVVGAESVHLEQKCVVGAESVSWGPSVCRWDQECFLLALPHFSALLGAVCKCVSPTCAMMVTKAYQASMLLFCCYCKPLMAVRRCTQMFNSLCPCETCTTKLLRSFWAASFATTNWCKTKPQV